MAIDDLMKKCAPETIVRFSSLLLLIPLTLCLFGCALSCGNGICREVEAGMVLYTYLVLSGLILWTGALIWITCDRRDWTLMIVFIWTALQCLQPHVDKENGLILLWGIFYGKIVKVLTTRTITPFSRHKIIQLYLLGISLMLASSCLLHGDWARNYYRGPRWTGAWGDPNTCGALMGCGVVLVTGLLLDRLAQKASRTRILDMLLYLFLAVLVVGIALSYSRGAICGTVLGLLYLVNAQGRLKWRFVIMTSVCLLALFYIFWGATSESSSWYLQRMDLQHPSVLHRVAAWRAGMEIIAQHPFGVGLGRSVQTYSGFYSLSGNEAVAMITNDYVTLGVELGVPVLACAMFYIFRPLIKRSNISWHRIEDARSNKNDICKRIYTSQTTCLACVVSLAVVFVFDGGLFKLPIATMFWALLELGRHEEMASADK